MSLLFFLILTYLLTLFGFLIDIKIISLLTLIFTFIYFVKKKGSIYISQTPTLFLLFFLIFTVITLNFSYDKASSLEGIILYISAFLLLIVSYNHQQQIKKILQTFFITTTFLTIIAYLIGKYFKLNFLEEPSALIYAGYHHNLIGNFLALGLIYFLTKNIFYNQKINIFLILLIISFLLLTVSRTAYFSIFIISLILFFKNKNLNKILFFILLLITVISLFSTIYFTKETNRFLPIFVQKFLTIEKEKTFFGNRPKYFYYTLKAFKDNPLGVGINNLHWHTPKYQFFLEEAVTTSHNFFLDILAENGIFAFLAFSLFLIYIIKNLYFDEVTYVFLGLNLVFLTDFLHRYDFFIIFYFFLAGLVLNKKEKINLNKIYFLIINVILLIISFMISSSYLLNNFNQKELAIRLYPFNWRFYNMFIYENKNKYPHKALNYLLKFEKLFADGSTINLIKAKNFLDFNEKEKALFYFEKAFLENPFYLDFYFNEFMNLNMDIYGEKAGKEKAKKYINKWLIKINPDKNSYLYQIIKSRVKDYQLSVKISLNQSLVPIQAAPRRCKGTIINFMDLHSKKLDNFMDL
ncbi:MAG: hypothetical protein Fur009_6270 [Candidatus Microgenomates bacterium]